MSSPMGQAGQIAETLVLAMLAVNNWSLQRAWDIREPLRRAGLTDPATVSRLSHAEIAERLAAAGYARGSFMNPLMARRIRSMGEVLTEAGETLVTDIRAGRRDAANKILRSIEGVGPSVVANFWALYPAG